MGNEEVKKEEEVVVEEKAEVTTEAVVTEAPEETKDAEVVEAEEVSETASTVKQKIARHWKLLTIALVVIVLILIGSLARSLFVAAIVDGEPISRLAVIKELEKRSGGQALDTMVIKKIILKQALLQGISISGDDVDQEVSTLEERMAAQGSTLEAALSQQGMTMEQFREQIILQKALEKILADKLVATDEEVNKYLEQTKAMAPKGMAEDEFRDKVKEQIKSQKFDVEVGKWLTEQKQKANIRYFVDYAIPVPGDALEPAEESAE
ncbi:MAG: SurA N-terminal domain-containing protein [Candidatus Moranbacteria bacterium]|nr:SurA N-terminal domain-containing protein [Candidatus Moranbacteria bacterium]